MHKAVFYNGQNSGAVSKCVSRGNFVHKLNNDIVDILIVIASLGTQTKVCFLTVEKIMFNMLMVIHI